MSSEYRLVRGGWKRNNAVGLVEIPEREIIGREPNSYRLSRIGRGKFTTAYLIQTNLNHALDPDVGKVILLTMSGCNDKELLWMAANDHVNDELPRSSSNRNPHLPEITRLGMMVAPDDRTVTMMPHYKAPLRKADSAQAWKDLTWLKRAWAEILNARTFTTGSPKKFGSDFTYALVQRLAAEQPKSELVAALTSLHDHACNYGHDYFFEFSPRNLATDEQGNLILLDVIYDNELYGKIRNKRR